MKKRTYRILTSIPIVGFVVKMETSPIKSKLLRHTTGSLVWESFKDDPRGALAAHSEYVESLLEPTKEYISRHPDVQLTAGLINKVERERKKK